MTKFGRMLGARRTLDVDEETLTLISEEYIHPENLSHKWKRVQFLRDDNSISSPAVRRQTWRYYIDSGEIDHLAILYHNEICAVLVRVYGYQGGMHLAHHVRLLQRAEPSERPSLEGSGTRIGGDKWCIT